MHSSKGASNIAADRGTMALGLVACLVLSAVLRGLPRPAPPPPPSEESEQEREALITL